jgi:uncharacterized protein
VVAAASEDSAAAAAVAAAQAAAGKIFEAGSDGPAFFRPSFFPSITVFMKTLLAILTVVLTCFNAYSQKIDTIIKSKPDRLVNDYAQVLSNDEKQKLEKKLVEFNKNTSTQIAIVLIKTLDGRKIEDASLELFNAWGIGQADKNNGLLILAAIDDRKLRIEVGNGLITAIPNEAAARIIANDIVPSFKEKKYSDGLNKATTSLMKLALQAFPDTINVVKLFQFIGR